MNRFTGKSVMHICRPQPISLMTVGYCALALLAHCTVVTPLEGDDETSRFFESEVRPLLIEQCSSCHGEKKQSGGLRVDSRHTLLEGGDTGPAIIPGESDSSLLIQAVRREGDVEMPPDDELSDAQVAVLTRWIKHGAIWPSSVSPLTDSPLPISTTEAAKDHWAFQPVREPAVPEVDDVDWVRTPVDAFVLAKLEAAGISPSPAADRRTLIRRATYALTGLPPSPRETALFVDDADPLAYERLIDRLLDSQHYGEHWARNWLDVARYSDSKGYVYAREESRWVHAWAYRDWVVRALNADLPYDRFLLLQLAADQVTDRAEGDLAAMGFLTLGPRFLGVKNDIIDDRIDVVCRGTMGLTVSCARCHDHKYDPIPTADYYSLYGVFDSCAERLVSLGPQPDDGAYIEELRIREEKLQTTFAERRAEASALARQRIADYLHAQTELDKYPAEGFFQLLEKTDLMPMFVRRWEKSLRDAGRRNDPVFVPWHAYASLEEDDFAELAKSVTREFREASPGTVNLLVAAVFDIAPASFAEVIERYGTLFCEIDARWKSAQEEASAAGREPPAALDNPAAEELRRLLYGPAAPCEVPNESIVNTEMFFDEETTVEIWSLQGKVDRWIVNSSVESPYALTLVDRPIPSEPRVFLRGNPLKPGEDVPRRFLSVVAGDTRESFQRGSGRIELAEAIIDPANPLTARVIVNRVWMHHFGEGLVNTPSDFGTRANLPSHPELLDWLASRFIDEGWSLKGLHRLLLRSATFRQSSGGPTDPGLRAAAQTSDPENRLLWRKTEHRLTFEEFRDTMLSASGDLDRRVGGKPADLFKPPSPVRRTLYGYIDRQFLPGTLRMFDFANPNLHVSQRAETTVPQQALFLMNHPLVLDQARRLTLAAEAAEAEPTSEGKVRFLFQQTFQRDPSDSELADALQLVSTASSVEAPSVPATVFDWQYGYGAVNEEPARVEGFAPLPHFTGTAWQGGAEYPHKELGWVQLTAAGGHPGNDRQHAAVRRWTAPRAMTVEIRSQLIHRRDGGDGIRGFVISSRGGLLESATVHQKMVVLDVPSLAVEAGETVDFAVDIGDVLNSDEYLWSATITESTTTGATDSVTEWNSENDFSHEPVQPLSAWDQLAQVLLCSNEFLFID